MWHVVKEHPRAFLYALLAHVLLALMLVFNLDWTIKPSGAPQNQPVQAVVIDAQKLDAEQARIQEAETRKEREAEERLRAIEEKTKQAEAAREREQQRLEEVKQKQAAEAQRLKEQEAKRLIEQKQAETEAKKKAEVEAKKKAEAEAKKKAEAEAKKKAEAEAKKKAEAEAKKKAEAEAKRKAAEEAERKAAEKAMQDQLAAERAALEAARNEGIISRYVGLIADKVQRNWIQPPGSSRNQSCVVQVQLIPGGEVVSVQIVQGSGDTAFDRSVEAAVYRASPLPLPPEPGLFDSFRTLRFKFTPR